MKLKKIVILIIIILFTLFSSHFTSFAQAGELEDIEKQMADLSSKLQMSQNATAPLESTLKSLEKDLANIQNGIKNIEASFKDKERKISEGDKDLSEKQLQLEKRIRSFYIKDKRLDSLTIQMLFGTKESLGETIRLTGYNQRVLEKDRNEIVHLVLFIKNLEEKKIELKNEKERLAIVKAKTDEQASFFRQEVAGAKAYQSALKGQIAVLSAQQQQIIAQKLGSLNLPQSLGAGALFCTDDRKIDPGFFPAFAFYTYGIPHRVGMNQYGALGRAQANQNYQDILRAYFNNFNFEGGREGIRIKVQGYGEMGLEDYLLGIYEMPESWPIDALKAQVIAARSYALAYTNNGQNEICTTQACQVYKGGNKGGQWEQAVRETAGQVMVSNGEVIKGWYSSTDGGYTFSSGDVWGSDKSWTKGTRDTSGGVSSFGELNERAYDKDSPCFYAAQGWRGSSKSAWLSPGEVADIANVILLVRKDPSAACFVYQTDKPAPPPNPNKGCSQTGNWSADEVRQKLGGQAISTANSVEVTGVDFGSGRTTQVTINGISFNGDEFKNWFNLRAPANIQIVGPLYNIEKK